MIPEITDHIEKMLRGEPLLGNDSNARADLYDLAHGAASTNDLAEKLRPMNLPPELVWDLLAAKSKQMTPIEKVLVAMRQMDPRVLDIAEQHPHVLKSFADSAKEKK